MRRAACRFAPCLRLASPCGGSTKCFLRTVQGMWRVCLLRVVGRAAAGWVAAVVVTVAAVVMAGAGVGVKVAVAAVVVAVAVVAVGPVGRGEAQGAGVGASSD